MTMSMFLRPPFSTFPREGFFFLPKDQLWCGSHLRVNGERWSSSLKHFSFWTGVVLRLTMVAKCHFQKCALLLVCTGYVAGSASLGRGVTSPENSSMSSWIRKVCRFRASLRPRSSRKLSASERRARVSRRCRAENFKTPSNRKARKEVETVDRLAATPTVSVSSSSGTESHSDEEPAVPVTCASSPSSTRTVVASDIRARPAA